MHSIFLYAHDLDTATTCVQYIFMHTRPLKFICPTALGKLEHLLRRYGPEADSERDLLHLYATLKLQDLFPQGKAKPALENPRTIILFGELQDRLAAKGRPQLTAALAAVAGPGADQRYGRSAVAFDRAGRARNPGSSVVGGLVLAVPAFHEFRPVRTP